jgi:STE24 endopeptidase
VSDHPASDSTETALGSDRAEAKSGGAPDAGMNAQQLSEAKQYGRIGLACQIADKLLDVAFLAVMALLFARPVDDWLAERIGSSTARLAALYGITVGLHLLISLPLSFYSGYVVEHQFGLSRLSFGRWLRRYALANSLALAFGLLLFIGLYWVIWTTGPWWWLIAAGLFLLVSVVLGQLFPVLILPLFYKVERLERPELADRIKRLAGPANLAIEGVYLLGLSVETVKANAMLAGIGRTRRVLLGDTLLDEFTPDEIEVIFAHEVGHHAYHHIWKLVGGGVLFTVLGLFLTDRLVMLWARRVDSAVTYENLPVYTLPLLMLCVTLFGMLLEPLRNAVSRRFERQCDRYALDTTGLRAAYISAFEKLAKLNKDDPDPHPVEVFLFHDHPPISERLAMAGR